MAPPRRSMVELFLRFLVRHPWLSFLCGLIVTALMGHAASKLAIRTNIEDLFPESTPRVVRAKAARAKLARASQILLVVKSPDREANERFVDELALKLEADDLIASVDVKHDIDFFKKNALLYLSTEELEQIEGRLNRAVKKAVAGELGPFDDEDGASSGGEDEEEEEDDLDEDFGDEEEEELDEDFGDGNGSGDSANDVDGAVEEGNEDEGSFAMPTEEEIRKKYKVSSLSEYLSAPDGTIIGIKLFPTFSSSKVDKSKKLIQSIEGYVAALAPSSYHAEMEWTMEGDYHKKIEEIGVNKNDLSTASTFALAVILVLVILYFGRLRAVFFIFVPLLSGLAWTMGLAWLTVGYLNLITAFIFAIMFGLGVDFAVHAANRYIEERGQGKSVEDALVDGLRHLGRPMVSAAITTTLTFLSLVVFDFRGFSQFGLIAGLGVPVCLLAVYAVFPPMVVILDRLWKEKPMGKRFSAGAITSVFGSRRRAITVVVLFLAVTLGLAPGAARVDFEQDMKKMMTPRKETRRSQLMRLFRRHVEGRSTSPVILLTSSLDETRRVHDFFHEHRADYTYLQDYASIYSFVPDGQEKRLAVVERMRELLRKKKGALKGEDRKNAEEAMEYLSPVAFDVHDLPGWLKEKFTDKDGNLGHFVTLFAHGHKAHAADVGRITDELDPVIVDGKEYNTTASYYILRDAYDIVLVEGPIAVGLAALAVLLLLLIDFRNRREVTAAFLPLFLGVVAYLGYMGWTGHDLNMFNMVILPTIFGIGIDTSIHLVHRVREEGTGAMSHIANTTGSAAGMSAGTTAIGFGSLSFATNPGLKSIGTLAPVGIILCYLAAVLLTCSFSYLWSKKD